MDVIKKLSAFLLLLCFLLAACGEVSQPAPSSPAATPETSPSTHTLAAAEDYLGLTISELMAKNTACLLDENGEYHDWAELYNASERSIELGGCILTDGDNRWTLPASSLGGGERVLVFLGGEGAMHAPFSLSSREVLALLSPAGELLAELSCAGCGKNLSLTAEDGGSALCAWPSPGYENNAEGYDLWQESLPVPEGLCISEVCVDGGDYFGDSDWVELHNASGEALQLADFCLSDGGDARSLPARLLAPGEYCVISCGGEGSDSLPFSLDSRSEQLYLSRGGTLIDAAALHDIPAGGSFGRLDGRPGWFYFASSSPGRANEGGARRVSAPPVDPNGDGVFSGSSAVVTLDAAGEIRYTTDGRDPLQYGSRYTGPFQVSEAKIVKACACEPGALPSRVAVLSYLFGEDFTLPVLSLCTDDFFGSQMIRYSYRKFDRELPGTLSLYEEGGRVFTISCGVNLSGVYSLSLPYKSLKLHFRSRYGDDALRCDLFGDGVDLYSSLTLRKGQDSLGAVFRTDLWEDLCRSFSDRVVTQKSRFCVLFLNGSYYGVCSMREDFSRQFYASRCGVSKSSVEWEKLPFSRDGRFYREVISLCEEAGNSLSDERYDALCEVLDIDSFIDWMIVEGVSGNTDFFTNAAFFRSEENGGKWQAALFDMDHAFESPFYGLFGYSAYPAHDVTLLCRTLCSNERFARRLLGRYAEVWRDELSSGAVLAAMDRYETLLAPEIPRDFARWNVSDGMGRWQSRLGKIRAQVAGAGWEEDAVRALFDAAGLDPALLREYFGVS